LLWKTLVLSVKEGMMSWSAALLDIDPPRHPEALADVLPLLERLDAAFGTRAVARLLGIGASTISNWKRGRHAISGEYAVRIMDLHDVMVRALNVYQPRVAMDWLVGHNAFLNGARPIDVLVARGSAPLVDALRAQEAGAYA
jgi:uncharacterized protein (DUF2384 family)